MEHSSPKLKKLFPKNNSYISGGNLQSPKNKNFDISLKKVLWAYY